MIRRKTRNFSAFGIVVVIVEVVVVVVVKVVKNKCTDNFARNKKIVHGKT